VPDLPRGRRAGGKTALLPVSFFEKALQIGLEYFQGLLKGLEQGDRIGLGSMFRDELSLLFHHAAAFIHVARSQSYPDFQISHVGKNIGWAALGNPRKGTPSLTLWNGRLSGELSIRVVIPRGTTPDDGLSDLPPLFARGTYVERNRAQGLPLYFEMDYLGNAILR
jgi:hypothetical protein